MKQQTWSHRGWLLEQYPKSIHLKFVLLCYSFQNIILCSLLKWKYYSPVLLIFSFVSMLVNKKFDIYSGNKESGHHLQASGNSLATNQTFEPFQLVETRSFHWFGRKSSLNLTNPFCIESCQVIQLFILSSQEERLVKSKTKVADVSAWFDFFQRLQIELCLGIHVQANFFLKYFFFPIKGAYWQKKRLSFKSYFNFSTYLSLNLCGHLCLFHKIT